MSTIRFWGWQQQTDKKKDQQMCLLTNSIIWQRFQVLITVNHLPKKQNFNISHTGTITCSSFPLFFARKNMKISRIIQFYIVAAWHTKDKSKSLLQYTCRKWDSCWSLMWTVKIHSVVLLEGRLSVLCLQPKPVKFGDWFMFIQWKSIRCCEEVAVILYNPQTHMFKQKHPSFLC